MFKKTVSSLMLLLLVVSMLSVTFKIRPVNADSVTVSVPGIAGQNPPPDSWIDSGISLSSGDTVSITATGSVSWDGGYYWAGPDGDPSWPSSRGFENPILPGAPVAALIAKIGGGPIFLVGSGPTTTNGEGELIFAVNDENGSNYNNVGSFTVTVVYNANPLYSTTIKAYCNTEGVDLNIPIKEDGSLTGFDTPQTFPGLTGTHTFTVAAFDANYHPFKQWNTGETTTTITVSNAGSHTAYYEAVPYPPTSVIATPLNNHINVTWLNPATWYPVNQYYVYRSTSPDFVPWNMAPYATVDGNTFNYTDSITDNTIYYYQVIANFTQGCSTPSPVVACARLESLKGVSNDLTGADSLSIPQWWWSITFQQNFFVFTGRYVYWCQNVIVKGMNAQSFDTFGEVDIFGPLPSDNRGGMPPDPRYRIIGGMRAPLNDYSFVSEIEGSSVVMQNSLLNAQTINLDLTQNAYIFTLPTDYPPNPQIDATHTSNPPNFVIVGNLGGYNEVFVGGAGDVSSGAEIGSKWIGTLNAKIVATGDRQAVTFESSEGLSWNLNGQFQYNDDTQEEGLFFVPDFQSQVNQPPTIASSSNAAKTLVIQVRCPVYLDLYDDQGNCVGYNESSGTVDFQMDNVFWVSNQTLLVFDPSGNYSVGVTGTGNGTYELETSWQDVTGTTITMLDSNSTITENETQVYDVGAEANVVPMNILFSKTVVGQGFNMQVNATVANLGGPNATFDVALYANNTPIGTQSALNLSGWNSTTAFFTWNTTGVAYGNYTLWANTTNNNCTGGWVIVSIVGDITGPTGWPDGVVNMRDIALIARCFGSTPGSSNWNPNSDLNNDGIVNMKDIALVARHFGQQVP